jgi:hypothetical protein
VGNEEKYVAGCRRVELKMETILESLAPPMTSLLGLTCGFLRGVIGKKSSLIEGVVACFDVGCAMWRPNFFRQVEESSVGERGIKRNSMQRTS